MFYIWPFWQNATGAHREHTTHTHIGLMGARRRLELCLRLLVFVWGSYCFYDCLKWPIVKVNDPPERVYNANRQAGSTNSCASAQIDRYTYIFIHIFLVWVVGGCCCCCCYCGCSLLLRPVSYIRVPVQLWTLGGEWPDTLSRDILSICLFSLVHGVIFGNVRQAKTLPSIILLSSLALQCILLQARPRAGVDAIAQW